jgi:DHA1 family tetracycline resistance protein-like MFS transporter
MSASSGPRRAALVFIFVVVVADVLALGIIIPVLPALVEAFLGGDTAGAARVYGIFGTVWALMQFFAAPVLGALSDRFGRRPVVLISCFGLGFDYILMALAPSLGWLFVGRVISGITASSFATAGAYIADVTPPERRAAGFGMIGAAFGLGFVLGPALGGVLGSIDLRLPFWAAAGLALANATYGFFVLPESLPIEKRAAFRWTRASPIGALRLLRSHGTLTRLAFVNFTYLLAHQVLASVFVLYGGYRYHWSERTVGLTLAAVGVLSVAVQGGIVRPVVRRYGERRTLTAGLVAGVIGYAGFGLAPTSAVFWTVLPVFACMGLFNPALQALMSRHVTPSEQGTLQGANTSLMGVSGMVGPLVFTQIFATFLALEGTWHQPGAPFLAAAGLMAAGLGLSRAIPRDAPAAVAAAPGPAVGDASPR